MHYQNIIHRDVKPSNLLLDENGHIKVRTRTSVCSTSMHSLEWPTTHRRKERSNSNRVCLFFFLCTHTYSCCCCFHLRVSFAPRCWCWAVVVTFSYLMFMFNYCIIVCCFHSTHVSCYLRMNYSIINLISPYIFCLHMFVFSYVRHDCHARCVSCLSDCRFWI